MESLAHHCVLTDYVQITQEAIAALSTSATDVRPDRLALMTHYTADKVGVRVKDIRCSAKLGNGRPAGLAGQYRLSVSVSVFGRK